MAQPSIRIEPICCLSDNYAWLVTSATAPGQAIVVDPGEGRPVREALRERGLRLSAIVITHHHGDHVGGIEELWDACPPSQRPRVVAGRYDVERCRVPRASDAVGDGESITLAGVCLQALSTPGHTRGATTYHVADGHALFTGDTLFLAGCGRLLEGTASAQYQSLLRLRAMAPATAIYCGHEYTEKNLRFAAALLPKDAAIAHRLAHVVNTRAHAMSSVPASVELERDTNVFWRCEELRLAETVGASPGLETFVALRARRDRF